MLFLAQTELYLYFSNKIVVHLICFCLMEHLVYFKVIAFFLYSII